MTSRRACARSFTTGGERLASAARCRVARTTQSATLCLPAPSAARSWITTAQPTTLSESWTCKSLYPYDVQVTSGKAKVSARTPAASFPRPLLAASARNVVTSPLAQGADFTGEVWIKLLGSWGTSDELLLAPKGKASHTFT